MASQLNNKTGLSIVGSDQVREHLAEVDDDGDVSVAYRVLPSNETGGFGQYYGGCLRNLSIGDWDEEDGVWRISNKRGAKLAGAFANAINRTPYVRKSYGGKAELPLRVLEDSSDLFSLDAIRRPEAKEERALLTHIFFDLDEDAGASALSHRQATLAQLFHVLNAYEVLESSPARRDIGGSCIFWPHYYGCLYGVDEKSVPYVSHPAFEETSAYWRQFCVHQFFAFAAEEVLQAILDAVSLSAEGMVKGDLVNALLSTDFVDELEAAIGQSLTGPTQLVDYFLDGGSPEEVQQKFSANHDLAEWWIYDGGSDRPLATRLARAFGILSQLYAKWRNSDDAALRDVSFKAADEWWIGTCFEWGDQWLDSPPDWHTAVSDLIDEVYARHELVKFKKGRLDAAWLEKNEDGCYTKMQDLTPGFRSNRHPNLATIFQDLCLLEDGGTDESLQLTRFGRATLEEVIKVRS
ncbi:MAG: hypothetical protein KJO21_13760 [Verrucomicrobiae bacterium]|nr:hypothetical protein [Verrucomicrobiae bacterium]